MNPPLKKKYPFVDGVGQWSEINSGPERTSLMYLHKLASELVVSPLPPPLVGGGEEAALWVRCDPRLVRKRM